MICNKCGTSNDGGNNFCSNCGAELLEQWKASIKICALCGYENEKTDKFCSKCGNNLLKSAKGSSIKYRGNSKNHKNKRHIHGNTPLPKTLNFTQEIKKHKIILTAAVLLALFFLVKSFQSNNEDYRSLLKMPQQTDNISLTNDTNAEKQFTEVADKFICSCGKCEDALIACDCDVAKNERNFIKEQLKQNKSISTIVTEVTEKYGHLQS